MSVFGVFFKSVKKIPSNGVIISDISRAFNFLKHFVEMLQINFRSNIKKFKKRGHQICRIRFTKIRSSSNFANNLMRTNPINLKKTFYVLHSKKSAKDDIKKSSKVYYFEGRKCCESRKILIAAFKQKVARTKSHKNSKIKMSRELKVVSSWKGKNWSKMLLVEQKSCNLFTKSRNLLPEM